MKKRTNMFLEACNYMHEQNNKLAEKEKEENNKKLEEQNEWKNNYYQLIESRERQSRNHSNLLENCRNDALRTALKAIYIEALNPYTLSDQGIALAESMVDQWVQENGGATKILNGVKNNTYFLARLSQIVEDAAEDETKKIEKDERDIDADQKEEQKDEKKEEKDQDKEKKDEEKEAKDEKKEADKENDDFEIDADVEDTVDDDSSSDDPDIEDNDSDDDSSTDVVIVDDDDVEDDDDEPVSMDGKGKENQGKVFDELEKEDDVKKAVKLIGQRVADAEETFIKRNAEDKQQIDSLLTKISDNIKTVEDMDDKEDPKSKVAEESARMYKQKINEITENRAQSVFEKLTRVLGKNIIYNPMVKEQYVAENGQLDMGLVVESAKVMYGFMETLNTLQLEKIDTNYIKNVLENMN